jgi:hypothetical protein
MGAGALFHAFRPAARFNPRRSDLDPTPARLGSCAWLCKLRQLAVSATLFCGSCALPRRPARVGRILIRRLHGSALVLRCASMVEARAKSRAFGQPFGLPESLSLEWPRESNQREGHPSSAPSAHPCAEGSREAVGDFGQAIPGLSKSLAASMRPTLRADRPPLAAAQGPRKSAGSCPQKRSSNSQQRRATASSNSKQQQQAATASSNSKQQQQAATASSNSKQQQQAATAKSVRCTGGGSRSALRGMQDSAGRDVQQPV